jgi:hypothetical protein
MSGGDLQEMEVGTKQSKTAVNSGAKPADPMPAGLGGAVEDLGGPTPENYKPDDDSAKLKTPGATLKQVRDAVTAKEEVETEEESTIAESDQEQVEESEQTEEVAEETEETEEVTEETEETEEVIENTIDVEEDINALVSGEELSEEFKDKAKVIFESALKTKIAEVEESFQEAYTKALSEEVAEIKESLTERVDSYLEYVSQEWITENKLSVETGIKEELTESFLSGMKNLFEEHYVQLPEEKYDVLESMVEKLDDMETKLNEQIEKNVSLNKRLAESVADGIFDEITEGLALSQKEKLASLAESVEFESEEEYREKMGTLKEAYFPSRKVTQSAKTETLSEGVDSTPESISGSMSAYLKTLSQFSN